MKTPDSSSSNPKYYLLDDMYIGATLQVRLQLPVGRWAHVCLWRCVTFVLGPGSQLGPQRSRPCLQMIARSLGLFSSCQPSLPSSPFSSQIYGRTFVLTDADEWAKAYLQDRQAEAQ